MLDLLCTCLDHSRRAFGDLCHCKIWFESFSSFNNMRVLIFCALGLKMPIHALEMEYFTLYMGSSINATPKCTFLRGNTSHDL